MATTTRGIVYPTVNSIMTPLANHFAALASSADAAITAAINSTIGKTKILTGTATLSGKGTTFAETTVTFPSAFASAPKIIADNINATLTVSIVTECRTATSTKFVLRGTATTGTFSNSYSVDWIAVGTHP